MPEKEIVKWLKIEVTAHPELMDALANFLTENGAQGVYQESPVPFRKRETFPTLSWKKRSKRISHMISVQKSVSPSFKKYLESLAEIFPDFKKPSLTTEVNL